MELYCAVSHPALPKGTVQAIDACMLLEAQNCDTRKPTGVSVHKSSVTRYNSLRKGENIFWGNPPPLLRIRMAEVPLQEALSGCGENFVPAMLTVKYQVSDTLESIIECLNATYAASGHKLSFLAVEETGQQKGRSKTGLSKYSRGNDHAHIILPWPKANSPERLLHSSLMKFIAPRNEGLRKKKFPKVSHGQLLRYERIGLRVQLVNITPDKRHGLTGHIAMGGMINYMLEDYPGRPDMPILISEDVQLATQADIVRVRDRLRSNPDQYPVQSENGVSYRAMELNQFDHDAPVLIREVNALTAAGKRRLAAVREILARWRDHNNFPQPAIAT